MAAADAAMYRAKRMAEGKVQMARDDEAETLAEIETEPSQQQDPIGAELKG